MIQSVQNKTANTVHAAYTVRMVGFLSNTYDAFLSVCVCMQILYVFTAGDNSLLKLKCIIQYLVYYLYWNYIQPDHVPFLSSGA